MLGCLHLVTGGLVGIQSHTIDLLGGGHDCPCLVLCCNLAGQVNGRFHLGSFSHGRLRRLLCRLKLLHGRLFCLLQGRCCCQCRCQLCIRCCCRVLLGGHQQPLAGWLLLLRGCRRLPCEHHQPLGGWLLHLQQRGRTG